MSQISALRKLHHFTFYTYTLKYVFSSELDPFHPAIEPLTFLESSFVALNVIQDPLFGSVIR